MPNNKNIFEELTTFSDEAAAPLSLPMVKKSDILHDDFFKIKLDELVLPNQKSYKYYTLITPGSAVVILGVTENGLLIINEEYRHPPGKVLLSCPGGFMDPNEKALQAAEREFLEETGYSAESFIIIGSAFPCPGITNQRIYYILADKAYKQGSPQHETAEIIRTSLQSHSEITQKISSGLDVDGTLCTALFFYDLWKKKR